MDANFLFEYFCNPINQAAALKKTKTQKEEEEEKETEEARWRLREQQIWLLHFLGT